MSILSKIEVRESSLVGIDEKGKEIPLEQKTIQRINILSHVFQTREPARTEVSYRSAFDPIPKIRNIPSEVVSGEGELRLDEQLRREYGEDPDNHCYMSAPVQPNTQGVAVIGFQVYSSKK